MKRNRIYIFLIVGLILLIVGFLYVLNTQIKLKIEKNNEELFYDEAKLTSYMRVYGPKTTIEQLHELSSRFGSCHNVAHQAGRIAYKLYNEKSFKLCSSECHSGCYHGATEQYFKEHGTKNLKKNLSILCSSELNDFFSHQCLHGVGHGLMAWTNYNLPEALKSCDTLASGSDSCWTGVFMENIVGGLNPESGHISKYLNDNPHFPCTEVDDVYKSACYFLQATRMMVLFSGDFAKIAESCGFVPEEYQIACYESMGREAGGRMRENPKGAITACQNIKQDVHRRGCLVGAIQDSFWDPSGQETALSFCLLLSDRDEKEACYQTIFIRAEQILLSHEERKELCERVEEAYQQRCTSVMLLGLP